jgi:hypothetical protein
MTFSLFSVFSKKSPQEWFWEWFEANEDKLYDFDTDRAKKFKELKTALSKVHPDLTFEFGPIENGARDFVISADGLKDAFPYVESLYAKAPVLNRWRFIKFRPRREGLGISIDGLKLNTEDIEVSLETDSDKVGLTVFIKGYNEALKDSFTKAAFLLLDFTLGEYDMVTKVGFIEIKPYEEVSNYKRHNLSALPRIFDEFIKR